MVNKRISLINGIQVDCLDMNKTIKIIDEIITKRYMCQHVVINASKVVMASKDKKLKEIINSCTIINADGQSIVWAGRFLGYNIPERVTGIDLMWKLLEISNVKGYKVYFLGATQEVLEALIMKIRNKFPGLVITGYRNGYWLPEENEDLIKEISDSNADILFVGISSPKKEYWLSENIGRLNIPFCMGVGGSFDVISGKSKRAPVWMQKAGLEWFFRLIQEPRRMWKRYLINNTIFFWLVIKEKYNQSIEKNTIMKIFGQLIYLLKNFLNG